MVELKIYEGDDLVLHQKRPVRPLKLVDGVLVYSGWQVRSARFGKIFWTEEEARVYRLRIAGRRAGAYPGGFVGAFGSLTVEPVEFSL